MTPVALMTRCSDGLPALASRPIVACSMAVTTSSSVTALARARAYRFCLGPQRVDDRRAPVGRLEREERWAVAAVVRWTEMDRMS